jgi:glutamyl/glutaminyl-tRNA synthetase
VERDGLSKCNLFTPIRLAVTGKKVSLPIHDTVALLPKEVAIARMERAL